MSFKRTLFIAANRCLDFLPRKAQRAALAATSCLPLSNRFPRFIAIEPTNSCNLKCPLCPVGAETMERRRGFMDVDKYSTLIDEIATHTTQVLMNFAGEPLLHPRIGTMVELAEKKGIRVTLGTHGNIDKMQELIDSEVSEVLFSLDGTCEDSYRRYRVGGSWAKAVTNLEKLVAARDSAPASRTKIILQFVVMGHNVHEIDELVDLGRRIGVDEVSLQPVCVNDFFPQDHKELIDQWVPSDTPYLLHPEAISTGKIKRPPLCVWAIQSVVLFNGDITICCFDADGANIVGNAFAPGGFSGVWQSDEYRTARKRVLLQDFEICQKCDVGLTKPTRFPPGMFQKPPLQSPTNPRRP